MKYLNNFMNTFILIYVLSLTSSCWIAEKYYGPTKEAVHEEIDVDKDGALSPEEIKASKYDLNNDGVMSDEEWEKATTGSELPGIVIALLMALNVPFAAGIKIINDKLKSNKKHVVSIVGGIEDLISLGKDGYTKEEIYEALKLSAEKRTDAKALAKVVGEIKSEIRTMRLIHTPSKLNKVKKK